MDEYVPARIPITRAAENPRNVSPPNINSATTTNNVTDFRS